jgi:general secretion pathway protein I
MRSIEHRRGAGGFTLIEVMIALAILAGGLVFLMRSTASNIFAAQKAQMLTAASNLARSKMYDIEETLTADGFQELDQTEEGSFADEGWPAITWKVEIIKIELPDMASLQAMGGQGEGEAGGGATAGAPTGGLLGGMLGMGGATGDPATGDPSNPAGAGIMGTYYSLVSDVLKDAIRKVTLTVSYPVVGGDIESFVVTCYFTDPAVVSRKAPGGEPPPEPEPDPGPTR